MEVKSKSVDHHAPNYAIIPWTHLIQLSIAKLNWLKLIIFLQSCLSLLLLKATFSRTFLQKLWKIQIFGTVTYGTLYVYLAMAFKKSLSLVQFEIMWACGGWLSWTSDTLLWLRSHQIDCCPAALQKPSLTQRRLHQHEISTLFSPAFALPSCKT